MEQIKKFNGEYDFLSNSYPSTFFYKGIKYKNVSQAYYYLKAKNEIDAIKILNFKNVTDAIKYGKLALPKDDWQTCCKQIMEDLLIQKFDNPFLSERLLKTGDSTLGDGKNFVGELLMKIRSQLQKENNDHLNNSDG